MIMNKIFTFILMAAIFAPAYGRQSIVTRHAANGESRSVTIDAEGDITSRDFTNRERPKVKARPGVKAEQEEEETPKTIYVRVTCPDDMEPVCVMHGSAYFGETAYWEEGEEVTVLELTGSLDSDNNILTAEFKKKDYSGDNKWAVIRNFDELSDGMEVTFDGADACNAYSFSFLNPDGERLAPDHYMVDAVTKEYTLLEKGNIVDAMGTIFVYSGNHQFTVVDQMFSLIWRSYSDGRSDRKHIDAPVFYLNDLPEGMGVCGELRVTESQEGNNLSALVITTPNTRTPGEVTNNPDEYSEVVSVFMPDAALEGGSSITVNVSTAVSGFICTGGANIYDADCTPGQAVTCRTNLCLHRASMQDFDVMQGLYNPNLAHEYSETGIVSQFLMQENSSPVYRHLNKTFGDPQQELYTRTFGYWDDQDLFKVMNGKLPAAVSGYDYILGNCAPLLASIGIWPESYGPMPQEYAGLVLDMGWFGASYCGRAGEALLQLTETAQVRQSQEGAALTFAIDVDGAPVDGSVQSHNSSVMLCNTDKADWVPPTAQLLWFADGPLVTDHFETPTNASLHLYAADFRYVLNDSMDKDMMEAYPLSSVKVEYAPHGSSAFTEIEVSENADMFFVPGYGYCYEGSLAGVDRGSSDGWMDLRISLADDSGNTQTQTLSPAFRVGSLAGVEATAADDNADSTPLLYDLQGRKAAAHPAPGIYIRRTGARTEKVTIR